MSIGEPINYGCPHGTVCACTGECRIPPCQRRQKPHLQQATFNDFCANFNVTDDERNQLVSHLQVIRLRALERLKVKNDQTR